jgi:hypothetical protein
VPFQLVEAMYHTQMLPLQLYGLRHVGKNSWNGTSRQSEPLIGDKAEFAGTEFKSAQLSMKEERSWV